MGSRRPLPTPSPEDPPALGAEGVQRENVGQGTALQPHMPPAWLPCRSACRALRVFTERTLLPGLGQGLWERQPLHSAQAGGVSEATEWGAEATPLQAWGSPTSQHGLQGFCVRVGSSPQPQVWGQSLCLFIKNTSHVSRSITCALAHTTHPPRGQAPLSLSLSHTHTYIDTHTQARIHMYTHIHINTDTHRRT